MRSRSCLFPRPSSVAAVAQGLYTSSTNAENFIAAFGCVLRGNDRVVWPLDESAKVLPCLFARRVGVVTSPRPCPIVSLAGPRPKSVHGTCENPLARQRSYKAGSASVSANVDAPFWGSRADQGFIPIAARIGTLLPNRQPFSLYGSFCTPGVTVCRGCIKGCGADVSP